MFGKQVEEAIMQLAVSIDGLQDRVVKLEAEVEKLKEEKKSKTSKKAIDK